MIKKFSKIVLIVTGWLCVVLGVIGIVLPILPTTPFMLLAAACFAKSSPRFHGWLLNNKVFGSIIKNWQTERYIEKKTKIRALLLVAFTFMVSILMVGILKLQIMLLCFWLICSFFIARLSTTPRSQKA
jgi:uncharacterized protein